MPPRRGGFFLPKIQRCYDSHCHLLATGQVANMLDLSNLKNLKDLSSLKPKPDHYRGPWLLGFGWDQHKFDSQITLNKKTLDQIFPDIPVAFSRADGHCLWINSRALESCELSNLPVSLWNLPDGAKSEIDSHGFSTGILIDRAMEKIWQFIPKDSFQQKKKDIISACQYFNKGGISHLRDMSGDAEQWQALIELDKQNELSLYIEQNFVFEKESEVEDAFRLAIESKRQNHSHLRSLGIKFYMDGALGSEGAWLSQTYNGSNNSGLQFWHTDQITHWIARAWKNNLQVSVHAIGDAAAQSLAHCARNVVNTGLNGVLNVEHAEIVKTETLDVLRGLNVNFHMQPCHWLTDSKWLKSKVGNLYSYCFPWAKISEVGFSIFWGSDAPIEPASLHLNWKAYNESQISGILPLKSDFWTHHQHPDQTWGADCLTQVDDSGFVKEFFFDGKKII